MTESRSPSQHVIEEAELNMTTLSVYQALLLLQVENLANTPGSMEAVTTAHDNVISIGRLMRETMWSETDWTERAQARALERLNLVRPNRHNTRWTLTEKGAAVVRWLRDEITPKSQPAMT